MINKVEVIKLGLTGYKEAWDCQEDLFNKLVEAKKAVSSQNCYLILCEHPHVYTLGKSGNENNLLINSTQLKDKEIQFFRTNRGGDITYHGPGQLVGYPIFDLTRLNVGLKEYIYLIEEIIILTLKEFNINSQRKDGATGVWIYSENGGIEKKVCAIGVKSSRYVTMHGFALNINTNLEYFNFINPCGFTNNMVTSMAAELGNKIDINTVTHKILEHLQKVFNVELLIT